MVVALAACGPRPATQQWTAEEVVKTFKDQLKTALELDPERSDGVTSVLIDPAAKAGYYTVWVFDRKHDPIDWEIGDVSVPPHGVLSWGDWEALDAESFPGEGFRTVLRTYGNVVLDYSVDQKKGGPARPKLPTGFLRVDSALSALEGFSAGPVTESSKVMKNRS